MTTSETFATPRLKFVQAWTQPVRKLLQHPWVESIVSQQALESSLQALHPVMSFSEVRARVVRVIDETRDTKTWVLAPNALWVGARAGQFVRVQLEINGRREERVYSLSSRPGARRIAITVKRQPNGAVSNFLHDHVVAGDVLTLSQAMGEFVLPEALPAKILLLSAGSGITPVMSMLRDLQRRNYQGDVVFLHICRSQQDLIFSKQLEEVSAAYPELSLLIHCDDVAGPFQVPKLPLLVPDLSARSTWLCGPAGLMDAVHQFWTQSGTTAPLASERFVAFETLPTLEAGEPVEVEFAESGSRFTTRGTAPLLVQAEQAGLSPKHGCRIGICRSCQCVKKTGTVQNLHTGELSSAPNELIRLCISVARSNVALDL
jgi:ferredoxin-NADP reductase